MTSGMLGRTGRFLVSAALNLMVGGTPLAEACSRVEHGPDGSW